MKNKDRIPESELILNSDNSVYHLNLKTDDVAPLIITVGDPDRVDQVTKYFDEIYLTKQKREFKTVTGRVDQTDLTVISTGIGIDNVDIVMNELDALFNIDLESRLIKDKLTELHFYRIGTSGTIQKAIPVDSFLASSYAIENEGILSCYRYQMDEDENAIFKALIKERLVAQTSKVAKSHSSLLENLTDEFSFGVSYTAGGFYGPQGRSLRLKASLDESFRKRLSEKEYAGLQVTNFEMETAGIYGLANLLGHRAISFNAILANRASGEFSKSTHKTVERLILKVLDLILSN